MNKKNKDHTINSKFVPIHKKLTLRYNRNKQYLKR